MSVPCPSLIQKPAGCSSRSLTKPSIRLSIITKLTLLIRYRNSNNHAESSRHSISGGSLRGCVGYVMAVFPLYRTVAETARAAAFEDTRFAPVSRGEAPELEVSLSILSPLREIGADHVEVGRHGLLISQGGQRGLLLPQVPVEHGWDRVTFLEQTCRKAGLPKDAWANGARIEAFTAEVFGDRMN